ncbi:hypothetical protein MGYG_04592 [Nannizzia gypsea CBS 118893]|uniref:Uncharacterized protein n=1 Tax=Arthroderma gypseum (strain ATCC MYA-4604 / CBS 118893) TaxID=535722 RepID=E4UTU6_ARTGP|nr:hypothetical protein MGYG_04592 [Nannizzia gypsea CBS 118893]EFR01589.1 hypothetical protein MGYG_04592 [Nannizzia gypsea CBS 118893]
MYNPHVHVFAHASLPIEMLCDGSVVTPVASRYPDDWFISDISPTIHPKELHRQLPYEFYTVLVPAYSAPAVQQSNLAQDGEPIVDCMRCNPRDNEEDKFRLLRLYSVR